MSLLTKLFSRKVKEQQTQEVTQIGTEIDRPTEISLPISDYLEETPIWIGRKSGWGYSKEDALKMATDNSVEGIHNEYVFAEFRSRIEVQEVLKMYYAGFERCGQRLVGGAIHRYDVITFKVYLFTEEDWTFLKDDYESHNNYQSDEAGLKVHTELRNQRMKYYISECWINIDEFYGKN
jgi:hypothetical protein